VVSKKLLHLSGSIADNQTVILVRRTLAAALILCVPTALTPAIAAAEPSPLAPSLQELAKPSVRALPPAAEARRLGIAASGPGSLIRSGGRVLAAAAFEAGAIARLPALRAAGAEIVTSSQRYQEATVRVPVGNLGDLAEVSGLTSVTPVRAPVLREVEPGCQGGSVISEGIGQLNVTGARQELETALPPSKEGEGLTIGVLSDSFNQANEAVSGGPIASHAPDDIINKDLPGEANHCAGQSEPVWNVRPYEFGEGDEPPFDEGRAMLQIIHDVVPKAQLSFTSAFNGELAFAEGIEELARPGFERPAADVIVDDVGYFNEPFFQNGPIAVAIKKVVEEGVTYLTAGGNDNLFDKDASLFEPEETEIASWEAPGFRDSGSCPQEVRRLSAFLNPNHCLDFNPEAGGVDRTFGVKVEPGETLTVDLQWNEARFGVNTDLDAYLLDAEGRLLTQSIESNVSATQEPVEIVQWENNSSAEKTVQLVINRRQGVATPRLKFILLENGGGVSATEYPLSGGGDVVGPTIYGHAGAPSAITLGAVPYNNSSQLEPYSSRGPATHYFGPVVGTTAATPLVSPNVISKPNAAATDCGRTTFFAVQKGTNIWRFCGTSAAAPHAAGIAALAIEANGGSATPAAVRGALVNTAVAVGGFGSCAAGAGLLEARGAVEAMLPVTEPVPTPGSCEPPNAEGPVFVAPGSWGLETPPPSPEPPPVMPVIPPTPPVTPPEPKVPSTKIVTHPPKLAVTHRARARVVFAFSSDQSGAKFMCQFDGSAYKRCRAKVARWFGLGQHVLRVYALASSGLGDTTPAVFRFKVVRSG
jgi:subtilisin family serine protease